MTAIEFNNVGKMYRLGTIGTGTLSHDLNRWWQTSVLHREDPYLKIGQTNDRTTKGDSQYVWALQDINFKVEQGDVVGIIGKNGAGKSTLLKLLSNITSPTTGTITYEGRIASLLEVGTGFHPEMTGRENIYMNGAIMGMTRQEITRKLDEIVDFAGCARYIDTPVKRYSSGMTVRLGFAIAAFLEPEILVVDEVLAVGDAEFQKKAIGKMQDVSKGEGRTVLFVSHNMASIRQLCTKGVLLDNGKVMMTGGISSIIQQYIANADKDIENGVFDYHHDIPNKIKSVTCYNNRGETASRFYTGDSITIEIVVQNSTFKADLGVGLYFKDIYGNKIVGTTSFLNSPIVKLSTQPDRIYRTTIEHISLTEGTYVLEVALSIRNGERLDSQCQAKKIQIVAGKPEVGAYLGVCYVDTSWIVN